MPIHWKEADARLAVRNLYKKLFGRDPEPETLRGAVSYLVEGKVSLRTQFLRMLKSEEFFDKRLRDKPPEVVADVLYASILGRAPENLEAQKGAVDYIFSAGWQTQVDVMINSEEYIGKFGDDKVPVTA